MLAASSYSVSQTDGQCTLCVRNNIQKHYNLLRTRLKQLPMLYVPNVYQGQ